MKVKLHSIVLIKRYSFIRTDEQILQTNLKSSINLFRYCEVIISTLLFKIIWWCAISCSIIFSLVSFLLNNGGDGSSDWSTIAISIPNLTEYLFIVTTNKASITTMYIQKLLSFKLLIIPGIGQCLIENVLISNGDFLWGDTGMFCLNLIDYHTDFRPRTFGIGTSTKYFQSPSTWFRVQACGPMSGHRSFKYHTETNN
jgi:hypothetical protein